jgi:hypothetical protein
MLSSVGQFVLAAILVSGCVPVVSHPGATSVAPTIDTTTRGAAGQSEFLRAYLKREKLYLEVPAASVNSDFLIYRERGDQQILRWQRRYKTLLLLKSQVTYVSQGTLSQQPISSPGAMPPILAIFPIEIERPDGTAVIDASRLFTTETQGFLGATSRTDEARSFVDRVDVYPENVELEAVHTRAEISTNPREYPTSRIHWSIVRLPNNPMRPRLRDPRVGFWMESYLSDNADYRAAMRGSVVRWRLEKKNPSEPISEPIKPIVFYVDPLTPTKWWPYIRKGIEAWQPAFEAAGFRNAIIARDPPVDDLTWSVDDIRHSVVRWYPRVQRDTTAGGGTANTVVDMRTGEILKANAYVSERHDVFLNDWYFTMMAPLDARAQKLPFPDSLMGELYQFVVSHEIGHALGLKDGSYGRLAYPVDSLRSAAWLRRMGHSPSIMNYARFNYVAQPEDSIPQDLLIRSVGPADVYSIKWGYTPIPGTHTPEEEKPILDSWARVQDTVPWMRFVLGNPDTEEAYAISDASDDADPIRSTELGVKNLRRVMKILPGAALYPGTDNRPLEHFYHATLLQWRTEMKRVIAIVGGFHAQYKLGSQPGPVYTPVPAAEQRAAVRFLDTMAFRLPDWLIAREVGFRVLPTDMPSRVVLQQTAVLAELLNTSRLERMRELEATVRKPEDVYSVAELFADLRRSLWSELGQVRVDIDPYRQELQQTHLRMLLSSIKPARDANVTAGWVQYRPTAPFSTPSSLALLEVQMLRRELSTAIPRAASAVNLAHLTMMRRTIDAVLPVEK